MNPVLKNALALVAGMVSGSAVNMGLVMLGPLVIPPPRGADYSTMEALRDSMELFTTRHFIFPFLAHALGTLAGAFVAARLAASHPMKLALAVGLFFLFGGIIAVRSIGGPMWFNLVDLILAYFPMACLGGSLASRSNSPPQPD